MPVSCKNRNLIGEGSKRDKKGVEGSKKEQKGVKGSKKDLSSSHTYVKVYLVSLDQNKLFRCNTAPCGHKPWGYFIANM